MKHKSTIFANGLHTPPCGTSRCKSTSFRFRNSLLLPLLVLFLLIVGTGSAWADWYIAGEALPGLEEWVGKDWKVNALPLNTKLTDNTTYYYCFQNVSASNDNRYRLKITNGGWGTQRTADNTSEAKGNVDIVTGKSGDNQISFKMPFDGDVYVFFNDGASNNEKVWIVAVPTVAAIGNTSAQSKTMKFDLLIKDGWSTTINFIKNNVDALTYKYVTSYVAPACTSDELSSTKPPRVRCELYGGSSTFNGKNSPYSAELTTSVQRVIYLWNGICDDDNRTNAKYTKYLIPTYPNRSSESGWKLWAYDGSQNISGDLSSGSITVQIEGGKTVEYFITNSTSVTGPNKGNFTDNTRHSVNSFGGCYVDKSASSNVTFGSDYQIYNSNSGGVYKLGNIAKPIYAENDMRGSVTINGSGTKDVTFTFDGGVITINAVDHSSGEEPGGGGGSSEPCETFTQGDVIYLRLGNENDGYWDYAGNEKMKATFSDGTSSQAICMEKVEDHLWSVEVPSSNLVNVTFDRYDGSCQWIWHEGGGFTKSVEDFGTNNCVYKPGYNNKNVTFETRGSGLTGCGGSGGEEPEELTGDYYVFGSGPDGSNWVTGWTKNVEAYKMTIADGVATKTFYNVSGEGLEFKIHKGETQYKNDLLLAEVAENNSHLIKKVWKNGTNIDFSISTINITHKADVTVHFDGEHIWLTAVPHPETVAGSEWYIMGSGNVGTANSLNWDKGTQKGRGNEHKMTVQDGVASITYTGVSGDIAFKVFRGSDNYEINDFYYDADASSGVVFVDQDGNDNINKSSLSNANFTIHWDGTKIWTTEAAPAVTYTVTIHPNGGTAVSPLIVGQGSTINSISSTYGQGTAKWYIDDDPDQEFVLGTSIVEGDMDLYAKWGITKENEDDDYYIVSCLQTASDAGESGNWSNTLSRKMTYDADSRTCSFTFVAPAGKYPFEIIKNQSWSEKINGGSYGSMFDNSKSNVTLSESNGHLLFELSEPKQVTVSYDGKVWVNVTDYLFDNSKKWRIKTSWGNGGAAWNYDTEMTNNGTTNATAILRNVSGTNSFIISTKTNDGDAQAVIGNETFNALYVDMSNPSSGLTWNTSSVKRDGSNNFNSTTPQADGNYWRNCKFTLSQTSDIRITFDGGKIRCDILPKYTVTFNSNGGSSVAAQSIFEGNTASEPADPEKDGYTFVKWQKEGADYNFSSAVNGNIQLDAVWAYKAISGVSLNESEHTTWVGNSDFTLTPTLDPTDGIAKSVTWSSTKESVATVSNGTVHAVAAGDARITVTVTDQFNNVCTAYCDVNVAACQMTTDNLYSMTVTGYNSSTGGSATLNGLWHSNEPATVRIVKLKLSNNYYIYDDNGTVKMSTDANLATAQWYEIPTGENYSPNWTSSSFALYEFKNVNTQNVSYLRRGNGRYGGNGDWYYYTTLTDARTTDGNQYKFFYDNTMDTHLVCREGADYNEGNTITELRKAFAIHNNNLNWPDGYSGYCAAPMVVCGYTNDPSGNTYTKLHEIVVVNAAADNPNYIPSQINTSYYRMNTDATVQANLESALVKGAVITVRLYADAATSVKLTKTDGTEIATINLSANAALDYTYTVNTVSALLGESAFVIKAADNHAAISSISVSRLHAVSPSTPDFAWNADLSAGITQSVLAGNIVHTASSTESLGAIFYTSSNPSVAAVAADGTVTPIMAGTTTITALIEEAECYAERAITYDITLTEPTLAELIDADNGTGITLTHNYTEDVVINKPITINGGGYSIGNLTVENAGDLTLGSALTVNDFTLCAKAGNTSTPAESGQVRSANNLTVGGNAYFLYTVDPSGQVHYGWYDFTVPFPVNVMTGIKGIQSGVIKDNFQNEVDYAIMEFLGDKQADGQYPYKKFRSVMQPNKLYSITLDDDYNYNTIRFQKTNDGALVASNSVTLNAYAGIGTYDNWNGVGNGTLHHADAGVSAEFIQVYQSGDKIFLPVEKANYSLITGSAFLVQETGTMTLNQADGSHPLLAPSRETPVQPAVIQIAPEGKPFSDQLFISADEMAGSVYTQGVDLAKAGEFGKATVPQIGTNAYNTLLCVHEAQLINGKAQYDLSLYAPANGTYTLTANRISEDKTLYLTFNGRAIWNLSVAETYALDLNKGITTEYGLLLVENYNAPTDIESVQPSAISTQKVLRNGILYILRNGEVFDAQGVRVQ